MDEPRAPSPPIDRSSGDARPFSAPPSPDCTIMEGRRMGASDFLDPAGCLIAPSPCRCSVEWSGDGGWSDSAVMAARVGRAFRYSGHMVRAGISKGQRGVATQTALRDCVVHVMLAADFSKASRGRGGSSLCFHPSSAHFNSVAYSSPYIHTAMIKRRTYELV